MFKKIIAASIVILSTVAWAGNSNGCQGNCPTTTTGGGTTSSTSNSASSATGVGVGVGVGVGYGGSGGSATGGSVTGSGNSSITDSGNSRSSATQGQLQGQQQGQVAQGGNGGAGGQSTASSSASLVGGTQTASNAVTVEGSTYEAQARNPVSSAWAAPLAASNGTCMGSTSAGAQGVTIGLSVGTTWTDENCNARYDAIAIKALGHERAAWARLCQQPAIRKAYKDAGTPCPGDPVEEKRVSQARPVYLN